MAIDSGSLADYTSMADMMHDPLYQSQMNRQVAVPTLQSGNIHV
jgi:hypothetical protein